MKILAVDDDASILELLKEALAVSGYDDVVAVSSGEEAIKVIYSEHNLFDCFLIDIQMPGMDGVSLCSEIRSMPGYKNTPVVMVTAMSQKAYIDRAFAAGATDYVTKPFDFLELGTRLSLAQKQVQEHMAASDTVVEVEVLKKELNDGLSHSLSEPIELQGIESALGYVAFENYVLQLTRGSLFHSTTFAVKVADIDKIYAKCSPSDFREVLTKVARNIAACTKPSGNLISYRGNGIFLCMNHNGSKQAHGEMEERLSELNDQTFAETPFIAGGEEIRTVLGDQVSLGVVTRSSTLNSLFKAVEKVESKALHYDVYDKISEKNSISDVSHQQDLIQKKSAYEMLLRESLREESLMVKQ